MQAAAGLLYLQQQQQQQGGEGGAAGLRYLQQHQEDGAAAGLVFLQQQEREGEAGGSSCCIREECLFQRADRLVTASMAAVTAAFAELERSVHATLDAQQGPAARPAADWQVLHGAMSRLLGMGRLRRVFTRQQLTGMPEQQAALAAGAAAPDDQQPTAAEGGSVAAGAPLLPPAPAAAPVSGEVAVSQARQAVGFTLLLPPNATLHGALQAARQCSQSMHSRSLIQVCLSRGGMFQPQPICGA